MTNSMNATDYLNFKLPKDTTSKAQEGEPKLIPHPDNGCRLEFQPNKSGIPPMAPRKPKPSLHSLPPILCIFSQNSISSYSKAPWGLSV